MENHYEGEQQYHGRAVARTVNALVGLLVSRCGKDEMYLACADSVISERQAVVEQRNRDRIAEYRALPWWRKLGGDSEVRFAIFAEWQAFNVWMDARIAAMRQANYKSQFRSEAT